MRSRPFTTDISLPPGPLSSELVRQVLHLALVEFRWFKPVRYGDADMEYRIPEGPLDLEPLLARYEERNGRHLFVGARTDRDFLSLSAALAPCQYPYTGDISWTTSLADTARPAWRQRHLQQVATLMRLVRSPLAIALTEDDWTRKYRYELQQDVGSSREITVRDYSEGLAGLAWRTFLGPPFVRLFGSRLESLPPDCVHRLGEELVVIQPYEFPGQAGSPEADARERDLMELLGPECFYDHSRRQLPSRRPVLPPIELST